MTPFQRMVRENPLWGAPRIHGEMLKIGIDVTPTTVPTATFKVLYVFLVLSRERRRVIHMNVTASPTALGHALN